MAKRTLYEALSPLRFILTLYGVNWRAEKNICRKIIKMLPMLFFGYHYLYNCKVWIGEEFDGLKDPEVYRKLMFVCFNLMSWLVSSFIYATCQLRWMQWDELHRLTKTCFIPVDQYRRIKRSLLLLILASLLIFSLNGVFCISGDVETLWSELQYLFVNLLQEELRIMPTLILFYVSLYTCVVTYYIKMIGNELIEDARVAKSNTRRARRSSRLIETYYRLDELIERTDEVGYLPMYVLRATTSLCCKFVIDFHLSEIKVNGWLGILSNSPDYDVFTCNALLLVMYLRVASTANQMVSSIGRVLAQSAVLRNTRVPMDSSYSNQFKIELEQLLRLNHLLLDNGQLTLSGDPVSGDALFSLGAEMLDNVNYFTK